jgi:hypothetical protein
MRHLVVFENFQSRNIRSEGKEETQAGLVKLMGASKIRRGDRIQILDSLSTIKIRVDFLDSATLNKINGYMDSAGWFPQNVRAPLGKKERYTQGIKKALDKKWVEINYESKIGDEVSSKSGKAYHVTPDIYIQRIKKEGLTPRSESKMSDHPERIYLFLNPDDTFKKMARSLWHSSQDKRKIKKYYVLEIDMTQLPNHAFYTDPESVFAFIGIYTLQGIPPSAIKVIETIPVEQLPPPLPQDDEIYDPEKEERIRKEQEEEKKRSEERSKISNDLFKKASELPQDKQKELWDLINKGNYPS